MNWIQLGLSFILVAVGDPLVALLASIFPRLVPVERPTFFSLNLIIWILNANETPIAGDILNHHEQT